MTLRHSEFRILSSECHSKIPSVIPRILSDAQDCESAFTAVFSLNQESPHSIPLRLKNMIGSSSNFSEKCVFLKTYMENFRKN